MSKTIFLDIDGVLNSNFWNATHTRELSDGTLTEADVETAVRILENIF